MENVYSRNPIWVHSQYRTAFVMMDFMGMIALKSYIVDVLMDIVLLMHLITLNANATLVGMELIVILQFLIFYQKQIQFLVDLQLKLWFLLEFYFLNKI